MKQFFAPVVLLLLLIAISFGSFAQNKKIIINWRVTSFEESLPLEGASVAVKDGNNIVTGSQPDGTFSLEIAAEAKTIVVSLQGYEKKEITLTGVRDYEIVLRRAGSFLAADTKAD